MVGKSECETEDTLQRRKKKVSGVQIPATGEKAHASCHNQYLSLPLSLSLFLNPHPHNHKAEEELQLLLNYMRTRMARNKQAFTIVTFAYQHSKIQNACKCLSYKRNHH
jgi:hypothetical protein